MSDLVDPEFDFDALQEKEYPLQEDDKPRPTRCRCDDNPTEYITCSNCGFIECEYYSYRYKSTVYCNECAYELCGKLIEKPKYAFSKVSKKEEKKHPEFINCEYCDYEVSWEEKIIQKDKMVCSQCAHDTELLDQYSEEQQDQLIKYAEKYILTIEEAIDYQTSCHCCGKTVNDTIFDAENHQYCKEKCFEHCEDYWYHCFREKDCKVCDIWNYHARRDSLTAYDIELSDCEPVLAAIDCFKELSVYPQMYESIKDLVDYFDSDRHWRHDFE
jgi:hypothetical protein